MVCIAILQADKQDDNYYSSWIPRSIFGTMGAPKQMLYLEILNSRSVFSMMLKHSSSCFSVMTSGGAKRMMLP